MKTFACAALAALFSCTGGSAAKTVATMHAPHSSQSCGANFPGARPADGPAPVVPAGLQVAAGLRLERIASVPSARELAFAPDGDLFVGTLGSDVYIVPNADGKARAGAARVYATLPDGEAAGVAFAAASCTLYAATESGIYGMPFHNGDLRAASAPVQIARVRSGGGGGHSTTSLALTPSTLYASVGSSCNACTESDPTRATIQQMHPDGTAMKPRAVRIRNAIALTTNPNTGSLWTGNAGQDALPVGHPFEFFDDVSAHGTPADYGWPQCEENHRDYGSGADCAKTVVPLVEFPAYSTLVGAAFVPSHARGAFALPPKYGGGAFVAAHGSWHAARGLPIAPPRLAFVPMRGDTPARPVNWNAPNAQWTEIVGGFQAADGSRSGRPTGVAIGPQGDLFFADDQSGTIYRVRP